MESGRREAIAAGVQCSCIFTRRGGPMGSLGRADGWMRMAGVKRPPRLGVDQPPKLGCDCAYPYCNTAAIGRKISLRPDVLAIRCDIGSRNPLSWG